MNACHRLDEMVELHQLEARLDRVESELAINRLAHDYCVGADHRDLTRWKAVWTAGPERVQVGIDAICAAVSQQWATFPIMQHASSNHVVDINDDDATGRSDVVVLVQLPDTRWIVGGGTYSDTYRREHGIRRIARREVVRPFDLAPLANSDGPLELEDISALASTDPTVDDT